MKPLRMATGFASIAVAKWCLRFSAFCFGPDPDGEEPVAEEEAEAQTIPTLITVYRISPDGPEPEAILKKEQP